MTLRTVSSCSVHKRLWGELWRLVVDHGSDFGRDVPSVLINEQVHRLWPAGRNTPMLKLVRSLPDAVDAGP